MLLLQKQVAVVHDNQDGLQQFRLVDCLVKKRQKLLPGKGCERSRLRAAKDCFEKSKGGSKTRVIWSGVGPEVDECRNLMNDGLDATNDEQFFFLLRRNRKDRMLIHYISGRQSKGETVLLCFSGSVDRALFIGLWLFPTSRGRNWPCQLRELPKVSGCLFFSRQKSISAQKHKG